MGYFKSLIGLLFLFASTLSYACNVNSPIKIGALDWESGQFSTALVKLILQHGYQCNVETVPGAVNALENALTQNDIQIITEQWVGRSPIIEKGLSENKVKIVGDILKGGATQGWYIPDYLQQKYPELTKLADLSRFSYLFQDPENPTKARFLNCPTGWSCEIFNRNLLKNIGLAKQFNNVLPGTGAALDAEISSAYEQKKPILFYYWQPTGLMAKYKFAEIQFPEFDPQCWKHLLQRENSTSCVSGFPSSTLAFSVSMEFAEQSPDLIALLSKIQFEPQQLNQAILEMTENKRNGEMQARLFLQQHPEIWQKWLSYSASQNLAKALQTEQNSNRSFFQSWSFSEELNQSLANTVQQHGDKFRFVSQHILDWLLIPLEKVLQQLPSWVILLSVFLLGWHSTRKWWFAFACGFGFYFIGALGLWIPLMQTLALLMVSASFIILLGIPLGILMACSSRLHRLLQPVLDVIQTMPSFVYLIPVLMLFGIGKVPALFATVIYATAPLIRLTALGIRQVNPQIIEAARSFGTTNRQMLIWVLLPQAKPSIMAGINQAIMMSLGMVVVASMIGAKGLGEYVLQAIQTLNIGQGVEAGTAIVILAIIIDRITQAYGKGKS